MQTSRFALIAAALATTTGAGFAAPPDATRLQLTVVDREPPGSREAVTAEDLEGLRTHVASEPDSREARFALVRGLQRAGKLADALAAARAWRAVDAYNLVVVRLLGDLYSEQGELVAARRTYSAVVELLPKDASAHRALASVLKQAGDLAGAYDRLQSAAALAGTDRRLAFELADVAARLGRADEATRRFEELIADPATPDAVAYPAKQRLAQLYLAAGNADEAAALKITGGTRNDLKVYLTWDTDQSDVDLWVTNPAGEKVFYAHKEGQFGEALFDDVTTGYGPESFTAHAAHAGDYTIAVNYFSPGRSNFSEARGEVTVVLDEGKPTERRQVLPYRLFNKGETVTVARIHVGAPQ